MRIPDSLKQNRRNLLILASAVVIAALAAVYLFSNSTSQPSEAGYTVNGFILDDSAEHNIPFDKILSGGPGRDGIPAIDDPEFTSIGHAVDIPDDTLGIFVEHGDVKRYYPYSILIWHEIVNDQIGDTPVDGNSLAFEHLRLPNGTSKTVNFFGKQITARKENGEIFVTVDGQDRPGYFEMWFSWATQHQQDGELRQID